jgi:hypothetical protein
MTRAVLCAACLLTVLVLGGSAAAGEQLPLADAGTPAAEARQRKLDIVATPIFGPVSLPAGGWGEVVVRIDNRGSEPAQGQVTALGGASPFSGGVSSASTAPYSVGAGASVSVRVPLRLAMYSDPMVEVRAGDGVLLYEPTTTPSWSTSPAPRLSVPRFAASRSAPPTIPGLPPCAATHPPPSPR